MASSNNIQKDIVKLIQKFYFDYKIFKYFDTVEDKKDIFNDFVCYSYDFIISKLHNFDKNKSEISTYVYFLLKQNYIIIIYQIKYSISFNKARSLYNCSTGKTKNEDRYEKIVKILTPLSFSTNNFDDNDNDINNNTTDSCIYLYDKSVNIEKQIEDKLYIEKILSVLDKTKKFNKKQKIIILDYIFNTLNMTNTAKKCNCSKAYVSKSIRDFRNFLLKKGISKYF